MKKRKAFTLIELLVVVAIIALLISILLPSLSRARELSKRLVCGSNLKGLGTAFKIYANDNEENWPTPSFDENAVNQTAGTTIPYANTTSYLARNIPGILPNGTAQANASTGISPTRAFWMMVRSGDVTPKQFICPSSGDTTDDTQNIDFYYDFENIDRNVSYGYQVPFGPYDTRASEDVDTRMVLAADRGPYSGASPSTTVPNQSQSWGTNEENGGLTPQEWAQFNSPNHGGRDIGEGQNCLFADGHNSFEKTPIVGVDQDNIYTRMTPNGNWTQQDNRLSGVAPSSNNSQYPGAGAITTGRDSSTDTLIFP